MKEGEKLRLGIKGKGLSVDQAAKMLKTSRTKLYAQFPLEQLPDDLVQNVLNVLDLNIRADGSTGDNLRRAKAFGGRQQKGILAVPIKAQAGYARMLNEDFRLLVDQLDRIMITDFPYDGDEFRAFQVEGDSMEYVNANGQIDGLPEGMWVVGQNVPQDDWAHNLSMYRVHIIVFARQIVIKCILQDNPEEIILHSDNEHYPQERRKLSDVKEIWYVVRKLHWDMPPPRRIEITV